LPSRQDDASPPTLTDDDLFLMYREGQADAFDCLFDRHYLSVYNFARTMLHEAGAAEEILQETFLAAARAAHAYESRGTFRTWLLRIARNRCLNKLEAQRVRREILAEDQDGLVLQYPSREPTPPQRVLADEQTDLVRRAMLALPDRQREAIALYAFEQMTYQQIADVLALPINTVKTLIHRARASLSESLNGRLCDGREKP
jgi:RNA polymerase sigma-70 factor (ECF subfamily)